MSRDNQFPIKFVKQWMYLYTFLRWEYFLRLQTRNKQQIYAKLLQFFYKLACSSLVEGVKNIPTLRKDTTASILAQT